MQRVLKGGKGSRNVDLQDESGEEEVAARVEVVSGATSDEENIKEKEVGQEQGQEKFEDEEAEMNTEDECWTHGFMSFRKPPPEERAPNTQCIEGPSLVSYS